MDLALSADLWLGSLVLFQFLYACRFGSSDWEVALSGVMVY